MRNFQARNISSVATAIKPRALIAALILGTLATLYILPADEWSAAFLGSSDISIDGSFSDWGTTGSPTDSIGVFADANNSGSRDGGGISGDIDIVNYWLGIETEEGGSTVPGNANNITNYYFRIDTAGTNSKLSQVYNIQLNLGVAPAGQSDHLLKILADEDGASPETEIVLLQYDTPYPGVVLSTGSVTGKVSNVSSPYSGFAGVVDANATGAIGTIAGGTYSIELKIPVGWFSSTYGGALSADGGTNQTLVTGVFSTAAGLGSVGAVKDTVNNSDGGTLATITNTTTGATVSAEIDAITQLGFTTSAHSVNSNVVTGAITVQSQDGLGGGRNVSGNTTVNLTSTSGGGKFDTDSGGGV